MQLHSPRLIGFGIKDHEGFEEACTYSDGAIIGSAFIQHLSQHGSSANSIDTFVKKVKGEF